ncbi:hypothetical protein [Streptomyces hypolithicus]
MSVTICGTGMLMALVNQDRGARALHAGFIAARGPFQSLRAALH